MSLKLKLLFVLNTLAFSSWAGACDFSIINNDSVIVGDRLYSVGDRSFLEISDLLGHKVAALDKDGKQTHTLEIIDLGYEKGQIVANYRIEEQASKTATLIKLSRKGNTQCSWEEQRPVVGSRLAKPTLLQSDLEIVTLDFNAQVKQLSIQVTETCGQGQYELALIDGKDEGKNQQLFYKLNRTFLNPLGCGPDHTLIFRVTSPLPKELTKIKTKTTLTLVGAANSSKSVVID
jgi:hypothetical protein